MLRIKDYVGPFIFVRNVSFFVDFAGNINITLTLLLKKMYKVYKSVTKYTNQYEFLSYPSTEVQISL